jgi:peptidoglycan/LPS O-acetylase OafA/YrhL
MAIFNEFSASVYLYIMMLLTDFWGENTLRDKVGWALLVFLSLVVLVNLAKVFYSFFSWVSRKVKKHVIPKVQTLIKKEQPTVAIKTEIDLEHISTSVSRSGFSLDML